MTAAGISRDGERGLLTPIGVLDAQIKSAQGKWKAERERHARRGWLQRLFAPGSSR